MKIIDPLFVLGAVIGFGTSNMVFEIEKGKRYNPKRYIDKKVRKSRSEVDAEILKKYDISKNMKEDLDRREKKAFDTAVSEAKRELNYKDKLEAAKRNSEKLLETYKAESNYDNAVRKLREDKEDAIREATEKARISFRLKEQNDIKRNAESDYKDKSFKLSIAGGSNDKWTKDLKRQLQDAKDEIIEKADNEIKAIKSESLEIERNCERTYKKQLEGLERDLEEHKREFEKLSRKGLEETDRQLASKLDEAKAKIVSERSEEESKLLDNWNEIKRDRNKVIEHEAIYKRNLLNKMAPEKRAALYFVDNGWTKETFLTAISFLSVTAAAGVNIAIYRLFKKGVRFANLIEKYS